VHEVRPNLLACRDPYVRTTGSAHEARGFAKICNLSTYGMARREHRGPLSHRAEYLARLPGLASRGSEYE
jgi:hypothetical protein